jgi:hypothetical protein
MTEVKSCSHDIGPNRIMIVIDKVYYREGIKSRTHIMCSLECALEFLEGLK